MKRYDQPLFLWSYGPEWKAADADTGAQALRNAAVVRLLLHNALRVDEACAADIADLGEDCGHRVLRVVRKGARKAKIPLTPPPWRP